MVTKIMRFSSVFVLALSLIFSVFAAPVASVNTYAAYGEGPKCEKIKDLDKKQKCLDKLVKKYEKEQKDLRKEAQKALKDKAYEVYNNLLSDINNIGWEIWNILTYGVDL